MGNVCCCNNKNDDKNALNYDDGKTKPETRDTKNKEALDFAK